MEEFKNQEEVIKAAQEMSVLNQKIKENVEIALKDGDLIKEEDFFTNEAGDEMIDIEDQFGNLILFNYTKSKIESIKNSKNEN